MTTTPIIKVGWVSLDCRPKLAAIARTMVASVRVRNRNKKRENVLFIMFFCTGGMGNGEGCTILAAIDNVRSVLQLRCHTL